MDIDVYIHIYIYTHICIYIYIHAHTATLSNYVSMSVKHAHVQKTRHGRELQIFAQRRTICLSQEELEETQRGASMLQAP